MPKQLTTNDEQVDQITRANGSDPFARIIAEHPAWFELTEAEQQREQVLEVIGNCLQWLIERDPGITLHDLALEAFDGQLDWLVSHERIRRDEQDHYYPSH